MDLRSIERIKELTISEIADACKNFGILPRTIQPIEDTYRICGKAVTVQAAPGCIEYFPKFLEYVEPGCIAVIAAGGCLHYANLNKEICSAIKERGAAGIVVYGSITEYEGIAEIGIPIFTCGIRPKILNIKDMFSCQVAIACGDAVVHPGDYIVGDGDGIISIPQERVLI